MAFAGLFAAGIKSSGAGVNQVQEAFGGFTRQGAARHAPDGTRAPVGADIREDLGNSYTVTYYPKPNPNEGFRKITIDPTNDPGHKWRIKSRPGYRPSRVL